MARDPISNIPNVRFGGLLNSERIEYSLEILVGILRPENAIPNIRLGGIINGEWIQESLEKILSTGLMCSLR